MHRCHFSDDENIFFKKSLRSLRKLVNVHGSKSYENCCEDDISASFLTVSLTTFFGYLSPQTRYPPVLKTGIPRVIIGGCAYELLRRTLGLGSTHRVWRVYLSRLDTRDVVNRSVLDTGMSLLTFLVQNQQRHPSIQHGTSNDPGYPNG